MKEKKNTDVECLEILDDIYFEILQGIEDGINFLNEENIIMCAFKLGRIHNFLSQERKCISECIEDLDNND